jgi:hypothetical protein
MRIAWHNVNGKYSFGVCFNVFKDIWKHKDLLKYHVMQKLEGNDLQEKLLLSSRIC